MLATSPGKRNFVGVIQVKDSEMGDIILDYPGVPS